MKEFYMRKIVLVVALVAAVFLHTLLESSCADMSAVRENRRGTKDMGDLKLCQRKWAQSSKIDLALAALWLIGYVGICGGIIFYKYITRETAITGGGNSTDIYNATENATGYGSELYNATLTPLP